MQERLRRAGTASPRRDDCVRKKKAPRITERLSCIRMSGITYCGCYGMTTMRRTAEPAEVRSTYMYVPWRRSETLSSIV